MGVQVCFHLTRNMRVNREHAFNALLKHDALASSLPLPKRLTGRPTTKAHKEFYSLQLFVATDAMTRIYDTGIHHLGTASGMWRF